MHPAADPIVANPIVVGTDGSPTAERAVEKAGELAAALGAAVHVVTSCSNVANSAWAAAAASGAALSPALSYGDATSHAESVVSRAEGLLATRRLRVHTHVCMGDAAESLITVAEDVDAQMIVVGSRGMAGARRLLGSVPNRVSHHAPCSVLIVKTC